MRRFGMFIVVGFFITVSEATRTGDQAFKIDLTPQQIRDKYEIITVGDLAVEETGLLSIETLCRDAGSLRVPSTAPLGSSRSEYSFTLRVERRPKNRVAITLEEPTDKSEFDAADIERAIRSIARPDAPWVHGELTCDEYNDKHSREHVEFYKVTTINETTSLSQLIEVLSDKYDKMLSGQQD